MSRQGFKGRSSISACSFLIWSYRVGASSISLVQVYQQWDLDMCKTTRFHLKFIASCLSMGKLIFINQLIMTKKSMAPPSTNPPSTASLLFVVRVQREPLPAVAAQPHGPDSRCSSCSSSLINRKTLKTEQHIHGNDMLICDAISDALPVPIATDDNQPNPRVKEPELQEESLWTEHSELLSSPFTDWMCHQDYQTNGLCNLTKCCPVLKCIVP